MEEEWKGEKVKRWKQLFLIFSSRNVKMLYRQSERSLSDRGSWLYLREKIFLYYIVIFYKIKYIIFRIQKPRAPACEKPPIHLWRKHYDFTFSPFHLFTPQFNISAVWTFFFNMDLTVKTPPAVSQPSVWARQWQRGEKCKNTVTNGDLRIFMTKYFIHTRKNQ